MRKTNRFFSKIIVALAVLLGTIVVPTNVSVNAESITDIISSVTPENGETDVTNVGINATCLIKIEFNEAMDPSTLNKDSIVVTNTTTGQTIDYTPVINDGTTYAIDPKDLANIETVSASYEAKVLTGTLWTDAVGNSYSVKITTEAKRSGGASAFSEDTVVTAFKASYFVGIPYEEGKYIADISEHASPSVAFSTTSSGRTKESLFSYATANSSYVGMAMGNVKQATVRGTITLDKAYDIAGMMMRRREGGGSYDIAYANYAVGSTVDGRPLLSTCNGFASGSGKSTVIASYTDYEGAKANNGNVITFYQQANTNTTWHIPNRIWLYAYRDMPVFDADVIESVYPENGAEHVTNVGPDSVGLITLKFKKEMDALTLDSESIIVRKGDEKIEYVPVVNDGTTYVIDPASLAAKEATGGISGGKNAGASWTGFYNQTYTVSVGENARLADGSYVTNDEFQVASFTSDYFVNIPYKEGKYIESVGTAATFDAPYGKANVGGNTYSAPENLLTEPDTPYSDIMHYYALNNSGAAQANLGVITLDANYDVAGIMVRTRYSASSAPSWDNVVFMAGNDELSAVSLLNTGEGLLNSSVIGGFIDELSDPVNAKYIYLSANGKNLFFPNKIWVYAYLDSPEKVNEIYSAFVADMKSAGAADFETKYFSHESVYPQYFAVDIDSNAFGDFAEEFVQLRDLTVAGKFLYNIDSDDAKTATAEYLKLIKDAYLLSLLNDGKSEEFASKSAEIGIGSLVSGETDTEKFAKIFNELKTNIEDNDSLYDVIRWSELLSYIEGGSRGSVTETLSKYSNELGVDLSYGTKKGVKLSQVAVKFDTNGVSKFYKSLNDEYKRLVDEIAADGNKESGPTGGSTRVGGGGGSGGGITVSVPYTAPAQPLPDSQPETDSNGKTPVSGTFSDMEGAQWAISAVERLHALNIVNGDGSGRFNPNNKVTREEFVKMIVMAQGLDTIEVEETKLFFDCTPENWYYPYVIIANKNKIVRGVAEYMFGAGQNITRQDAAVILANILGGTSDGEISFTDKNSISDYAVNAVSKMANAGIISGFESGEFKPLDNATRAEAAVLVARMLDYIGGEKTK